MTQYRNIEERISAYLDNEMSEADRLEFEAGLETDPGLAERVANWQNTDSLFASSIPTPSTAHLEGLVAAAQTPLQATWQFPRIAAMLAIFAFGGLGGYGLSQLTTQPGPTIIVQATMGATSAHRIFAAEARHAVEVGADETEHLQTWLSKRMGREMTVPQLEGFGLTFLGGRMLPFEDRAAAQYMYESASGERLTLFMARLDDEANTAVQTLAEQGLTSLRWQSGPWIFILTAPIDGADMAPIQSKVRDTLL